MIQLFMLYVYIVLSLQCFFPFNYMVLGIDGRMEMMMTVGQSWYSLQRRTHFLRLLQDFYHEHGKLGKIDTHTWKRWSDKISRFSPQKPLYRKLQSKRDRMKKFIRRGRCYWPLQVWFGILLIELWSAQMILGLAMLQ